MATTKEQMRSLLGQVYRQHGPREGRGGVVKPDKFARMTDSEVNKWDFADRFFMREIAKAIASRR